MSEKPRTQAVNTVTRKRRKKREREREREWESLSNELGERERRITFLKP